ncbi:MAG TPA: polysaccharide biosynthesis tyrosine autokinase [Bacteroidales bacterium]|nr:polysaccharide biosynthesis tyrosine autokinase [Bacteroidales bacterium]
MYQAQSQIAVQEESDLKRALGLFTRNYKLLLICAVISIALAYFYNRIAVPVYYSKAALLIENNDQPQMRGGSSSEEYINMDLFGRNQSFQNELYVLKSTPVIEQTIKNLDLSVNYLLKNRFRYFDAYKNLPFKIVFLKEHVQPVNVRFLVSLHKGNKYTVKVEKTNALFTNLYTENNTYSKEGWTFEKTGKYGDLIETNDLAFVIFKDSIAKNYIPDYFVYAFSFSTVPSLIGQIKNQLNFSIIDRDATVVEIGVNTTSYLKGNDIITELMDVYSTLNVNRKNHIAEVTIEYIERQLGEISDSLNMTEDNLQRFRSSRELLDVNDQANGMSEQYMNLQNQMAELITKKRYYDYLSEYLANNDDVSNVIVPTSMGVDDEVLNGLVATLITAQTQRSNLIRNHQERNPMVPRLGIQIENSKKTIRENISAVQKTTEIAIDEMDKRINKIKSDISRVPKTQRQLGGIERKYRLNDAIYNYLLEKRAEAKISQASNLPDNVIIESANFAGKVSPNTRKNYLIAFILGLMFPYGFLFLKGMISEKLDYNERIDRFTDAPILGKIPHSRKKSNNVVHENPKSTLAEAYRALRTNIEYRFKDTPHKVILVTSSIEGEGKSFNALNLAMVYAHLGRKTILIDFDLRKPTGYFSEKSIASVGLSSYFAEAISLEDIIQQSPHNKLDYIPSGPIPPNPVEMMASNDLKQLFNQLKGQYEYIILDATPLAQVSDAYLLMDDADLKIIIARYNYTLKKIFFLIMNDLKQKKVENLCIVLNDNRIGVDQYGYGYGYNNRKKDPIIKKNKNPKI